MQSSLILIPFCALLVSLTRHGDVRRALLLSSSLAALSLWPWRCAVTFFLFHVWFSSVVLFAPVVLIVALFLVQELAPVQAEEIELHPPEYPWSHNGWLDTLDHAR